tara:strand:- start:132 stop:419 length:288 start_codon:yes stop_codon:yes gene_type:complete
MTYKREPKGSAKRAQLRWKEDMIWVFKKPYLVAQQHETCPVWGDKVPFKSVTVVIPEDEEKDAVVCLACAHGGGWSRRKAVGAGLIALRSDYQAW